MRAINVHIPREFVVATELLKQPFENGRSLSVKQVSQFVSKIG